MQDNEYCVGTVSFCLMLLDGQPQRMGNTGLESQRFPLSPSANKPSDCWGRVIAQSQGSRISSACK